MHSFMKMRFTRGFLQADRQRRAAMPAGAWLQVRRHIWSASFHDLAHSALEKAPAGMALSISPSKETTIVRFISPLPPSPQRATMVIATARPRAGAVIASLRRLGLCHMGHTLRRD